MNTESPDWIDAWHDLYVMLGTSSAALLGLLFVATSIHLGEVVSNLGFRVRSYNQTVYLLILLVVAVLILVPQPLPFLGAELMVLNLVGLWIFIRTYYTFFYKHRDNSHRGGAVSVYGMGRFPVTLYKEQWLRLLDMADDIRAFIAANEAHLKTKNDQ
jgi:uncharacterized membrane protein